MKIVLVGTTAVHHTLVAAHLYMNTIHGPDFGKLDGYCDMSLDYSGYPLFIGNDEDDNQIYTLGLGRLIDVGYRAIHDFQQIIGGESGQLLVQEIRIPSELDIWAASKASRIPLGLGSIINRLISDHVIAREFPLIQMDVTRLNDQVSFLQGVSCPQVMVSGA